MEEWACPLCTRRRGGLRTAALRTAPAKFDPEAAADARAPQEEGLPGDADLPRSARGRHAAVDSSAAVPTTGLKLRLPASTEVCMQSAHNTAKSRKSKATQITECVQLIGVH